MNVKELRDLISSKETELNEVREAIKVSEDIEEVRSLGAKKEEIENELNQAKTNLKEEQERGFNPLQTLGAVNMENLTNKEYRMAFANLITKGTSIPAELRASTLTSDVAAAIPENLIPEIIEKLESYGNVLPLVTKTSFKVGQSIAVDSVKPVASWVSEGATSDKQNKTLTSITFGAYKLRCEIAFTQEVSVQSLPAFEALFVKQIAEALAKAIEAKIVSDNASVGSPRGILAETGASVTIPADGIDYKTLCEAEGALPAAYETNAKWFMNKKTFMSVYAMEDSNGQPVGRVNYGINGKPERFILGREVIVSEHLANDVAFIFDPSDYVLNTSYDLGIQRKQDWDTEDHLVKGVMSVDGKVIDATSLVKLSK